MCMKLPAWLIPRPNERYKDPITKMVNVNYAQKIIDTRKIVVKSIYVLNALDFIEQFRMHLQYDYSENINYLYPKTITSLYFLFIWQFQANIPVVGTCVCF